MTQEDKELLLKDLCARLPYGVKIYTKDGKNDTSFILKISDLNWIFEDDRIDEMYEYDGWKPYLRQMSSMTEEECRELTEMTITSPNLETAAVLFRERHYEEEPHWRNDWAICSLPKVLNWLNAHHFDYRGLIERGLALEAPEGIYN